MVLSSLSTVNAARSSDVLYRIWTFVLFSTYAQVLNMSVNGDVYSSVGSSPREPLCQVSVVVPASPPCHQHHHPGKNR